MKTTIILLAGLALAGTAFAKVDPAKPMVTGRGNVEARPARVIKANQTAPAAPTADAANAAKSDEIVLDRMVVTGSLIKQPAVKAVKR